MTLAELWRIFRHPDVKSEIAKTLVPIIASAVGIATIDSSGRADSQIIESGLVGVIAVGTAIIVHIIAARGPVAIARGLAYGYVFNFLDHVDLEAAQGRLTVKFDNSGPTNTNPFDSRAPSQTFRLAEVGFVLHYPKDFSQSAINNWKRSRSNEIDASIDAPNYHLGMLRLKVENRGGRLLIHDSVNTYLAIKYYGISYLEKDPGGPWDTLCGKSFTAFRSTVLQLIEAKRASSNAQGITPDMITWHPC